MVYLLHRYVVRRPERSMRYLRPVALLGALGLLTSCDAVLNPPKMSVTRYLWRGITVTNDDTRSFQVQRIIANGSPENANCNNYPNHTLAPGETQTAVFLLCGNIRQVEVATDIGSRSFVVEGD
ncbi:MAG: hypothetical protein QM608_02965 [Caulobacter sp.]